MEYKYVAATEELLKIIWEKNIEKNQNDDRRVKWREEALADNAGRKKDSEL